MTKAKKTAEIGSKEASKLPLTAPTKEVPFKKLYRQKSSQSSLSQLNPLDCPCYIGHEKSSSVKGIITSPGMSIPIPITNILPIFELTEWVE